jgi:Transposase IS116/IS110/IS902 family
LAKLGIPVTCTDIFGAWGNTWWDVLVLPQPYAGKMASLRKVCAVLADEIARLEAVIAGLLEDHQGYRAVRALPGIGPVVGAVIVAEIGDITRFPRPAELCSWAGLTPRHRESDIKVQPRAHHQDGMCERNRSARSGGRCAMAVAGLDLHRGQLTFDYVDLGTGEARRGRICPVDRASLRGWLLRFDAPRTWSSR